MKKVKPKRKDVFAKMDIVVKDFFDAINVITSDYKRKKENNETGI